MIKVQYNVSKLFKFTDIKLIDFSLFRQHSQQSLFKSTPMEMMFIVFFFNLALFYWMCHTSNERCINCVWSIILAKKYMSTGKVQEFWPNNNFTKLLSFLYYILRTEYSHKMDLAILMLLSQYLPFHAYYVIIYLQMKSKNPSGTLSFKVSVRN